MSARAARSPASLDIRERGAQRLYQEIAATYDPRVGFAKGVEAALRATLALFAADPDLARLLTAEPFPEDEASIACYRRWKKRYGALLRHAAAGCPEASVHPPFVEPVLIDGIRSQISRRVLAGKTAELEALLPVLLEFVLVYYLDPQQTASYVRAARAKPL